MKIIIENRHFPKINPAILQALNMSEKDFYQWATYQYTEVDPYECITETTWVLAEELLDNLNISTESNLAEVVSGATQLVFQSLKPKIERVLNTIPQGNTIDFLDFDEHFFHSACVLTVHIRPE